MEGRYSDPFHPGCRRTVSVDAGRVTGADGAGPGGACRPGEPVKEWSLPAAFAKDGLSMKVDFSPKGWPKDLTGRWNGKDAIIFSDGNSWTKIDLVAGSRVGSAAEELRTRSAGLYMHILERTIVCRAGGGHGSLVTWRSPAAAAAPCW